MIKHLKKLAVINDLATDEVAVLSNITDGPDGAATFGIGNEITRLQIEDNQSVHNRITRTLDIRTLVGTASEETNLDSYVSNQTKVYIVGLGVDGFVLIGDKQTAEGLSLLSKKTQYGDNEVWEVQASKTVQPGHDPDTGLFESGFWVGENGLGGYLWGDVDSDGVADGWDASTFDTATFATGQQTLTAGLTSDLFTRVIYFPFEGIQITFSINNDSRSGTYTVEQVSIVFLDATGAVITTQTQTFSTTGRKNITGTCPAGTVSIKCRFDIQASTGTVTSKVSDPMLALGTSTTYTPN